MFIQRYILFQLFYTQGFPPDPPPRGRRHPGLRFLHWPPLFWQLWHSVPERASYGTESAFGAQKGFLWYATHFRKPSVLKTGFYGTEGIFGTGNALLRYETELVADPGSRMQPNAGPGSKMRLLQEWFRWWLLWTCSHSETMSYSCKQAYNCRIDCYLCSGEW